MNQELVLLGAGPELAIEALKWTELACARAGIASGRAQSVANAVVEAVNNSIEHGYRMQPGSIAVAVDGYADRIEVSVSDSGTGLPCAPTGHCPDPSAERGRGSWIMRQSCDDVRHEFPPGAQRVVLVLRKPATADSSTGDAS
jgi:anti-sigma regulatory factor (Ser/Thr protein kinase)